MSSSGLARHEPRSVNVELNLLAERIEEKARLSWEFRRWGLRLIAVVSLGSGLLWGGFHYVGKVSGSLATARSVGKSLHAEEQELSAKVDVAAARLSTNSVLEDARRNMRSLVGIWLAVLNEVPPTVALSKTRIEVLDGNVTITGSADAETLREAQQFISALKAQGVEAVMTSAKRNDYLGPGGVGFEFTVTGGTSK